MFNTEDAARHQAAVRAGFRTAAQAARGWGAGVVASVGASLFGVDWVVVAGVAGAGAIGVVWAGFDAYLGIIANGVPQAYKDAALAVQANLTPLEREADAQAALSRVTGRHEA